MPRISKKKTKKLIQDGSLRKQQEMWLENKRLRGWKRVTGAPFAGRTELQGQCKPSKGRLQSLKKDSKKERANIKTRHLRVFELAWGGVSGGETLRGIVAGQDTLQRQNRRRKSTS